MANTNAPRGLVPLKVASSHDLELCIIPSGDTKVYGKFDPVEYAGTSSNTNGGPTKPDVVRSAGGSGPIMGVIMGFCPQLSNTTFDNEHRPASTAMYCLVQPCRDGDRYLTQSDDDSTLLTEDSVGSNVDLVADIDANTTTGYSKMQIDSSTINTTNTLQLKIVEVSQEPSNEPGVTNQKFVVEVNSRELGAGTGSTGTSN